MKITSLLALAALSLASAAQAGTVATTINDQGNARINLNDTSSGFCREMGEKANWRYAELTTLGGSVVSRGCWNIFEDGSYKIRWGDGDETKYPAGAFEFTPYFRKTYLK